MSQKRFSKLAYKANTLGILLVLVSAITLATFFLWKINQEHNESLVADGIAFAKLLAANSEYAIYTEDEEQLERLVSSVVGQDQISYSSVMDIDGNM